MAESLGADFKFPGQGRRSFYNWSEWLNGDVWQLERGKDFKDLNSARGSAYSAAMRSGKKVKTYAPNSDTLIIQASCNHEFVDSHDADEPEINVTICARCGEKP